MKRIAIFGMLLLMMFSSMSAKIVTGSVTSGKHKLSGVIVSDGQNLTVTDKHGKFRMEISDQADFVFVVTPRGYTAPFAAGAPEFYIPASHKGRFDFELLKTTDSSDYAIIAIADPQTNTEAHFQLFQEKGAPELISAAAAEKEKFANVIGVDLGDITWDRTDFYPAFKQEFAKTLIPFYPVIGNHDYLKDEKGDWETAADYRKYFGPENYAFAIGDDYMIVLDNIIYDTQKKYVESYNSAQLEWVKHFLEFVPEDSHIWISQHCPFQNRFRRAGEILGRGQELLEILGSRPYTFLSGHTHINNVLEIAPDRWEHNIASLCGSWWISYHCNDGTPSGYKVFEKKDGQLTWFYKSLKQDPDFQMQVFKPGESELHPNAVIANVWDVDSAWKIEWYQDGKDMGKMTQVDEYSPAYIRELNARYANAGKKTPRYKMPHIHNHYFMAVPSQYAKEVEVVVTDRFGKEHRQMVKMDSYVDVQAHRGGAGLMPENTVEAMKNALGLGVNTLELDLQISQDGQVVVSHDAYFHSRYSTRPDGTPVQKSDPKEYLYTMPYEVIKTYDTGMRPGTNWPDKACLPTHKPLASELIGFVENYTREHGLTPVRYNIEIKSRAGELEGKCWPEYHEFVDKCVAFLQEMALGDRLVIQSFDTRALNYMHERYPELILSYLVDKKDVDFDKYMALLDFTPQWLSPHWSTTDASLMAKVREKGMKIVPWTVDTPEEIKRLIDLGVDAIISNYPDRVLLQTRGYVNVPSITVR